MIKRCFWLAILLFIRIILGLFILNSYPTGQRIRVTGYIDKIYQDNSNNIIKIDKFLFLSENIGARKAGDKIRVFGTLDHTVIDSLQGNLWLRNAIIDELEEKEKVKILKDTKSHWLDNFRNFLVDRFKKSVPEPEAGLIAGVVLGYKKDIGSVFYDRLIKSGTIHIAVASGYNILLVGGTVMSLCFWFWKRKWATAAAITAMIFYALLAGGEAPVVRAVWMAAFLFIGKLAGRTVQATWCLILAAWTMLMIKPSEILSVSFQLSVAASVGLLIVEPKLIKYLQRKADERVGEFLTGLGFTTTVSTMVTTIPFLWWHFGRLSLIGIVSNSLILPLVPVLMILGTGLLVLPPVFSVPVYAITHLMVKIIYFLGG